MQVWEIATGIALFLAAAAVAWTAGTSVAALVQPRARRRPVRPQEASPVSVIIPVRAPAPVLAACTRSLAAIDYPDFEVILCAGDDDREAVAEIERIAAADRRFRTCIAPASAMDNPKIALLEGAVAEARHDLLLLTDDNVLSEPTRLQAAIACRSAGYGLVSASVFGIVADNFWAEVDGAFMNGHFARLQRAGDAIGLSHATGKSMLLSRAELHDSGGIGRVAATLCEDAALQRQLETAGHRTALSHERLHQPLGKRTFDEVWHRHLRWAACRRRHAVLLFALEALLSTLVASFAGGIAGLGLGIGFLAGWLCTICLLLGIEWTFLGLAHGPSGLRYPAAWLAREVLVVPLWFAALAPRRNVVWRRRSLLMRT